MSKNRVFGAVIALVAAASAAAAAAFTDYVISADELIIIGVAAVSAAIAYLKQPAA